MAARRFGVELSPDHVAAWARGDGLVVEEPAVLARQRESGRALAFGAAALLVIAGLPARSGRPRRHGSIAECHQNLIFETP